MSELLKEFFTCIYVFVQFEFYAAENMVLILISSLFTTIPIHCLNLTSCITYENTMGKLNLLDKYCTQIVKCLKNLLEWAG